VTTGAPSATLSPLAQTSSYAAAHYVNFRLSRNKFNIPRNKKHRCVFICCWKTPFLVILLKVLAQPITVEIFWKIGDSVTFDIQLKLFFSEKIQMFFTKCGDQISIADCGSVAFHKR